MNPVKNAADTPVTDLDAIMKDGLEQFHIPVEGNDDLPPGSTPDDAAPGSSSAAPNPTGDPAADHEPPAFRFTSHEEAERGYKELQRQMTAMAEEKKSLMSQLSEKAEADARAAAEEAGNQEFLEFATQRRAQVLKEIEAMDPDKPEYSDEVAAAYARADLDIFRKSQAFSETFSAAPPAPQNPAADNDTNSQHQAAPSDLPTDATQIRDYVNTFISSEEIGLEKDDPLFWTYASQAPEKDESGQPLPLESQIQWAVEQTRLYSSRVLQRNQAAVADSAQRRAEAHSRQEMPLGRAGATAPGVRTQPAADAPVSLSDAVEAAKELRRL